MINICSKCVAVDTRPGLNLDDEQVCFPCRIRAKKIDWGLRRNELDELAHRIKKKQSQSSYDCIVSVSGGKDSTRQSLIVRDELKLKPLLVCCAGPPELQTEVGVDNLKNLIELGFDCISVTPSPQKYKTLMKNSLLIYGNHGRADEMALYSTAPRIATNYKIRTIFLGENNALTYGDVGGSLGSDANQIKYNNTLSGGIPTEYMDPGMKKSDVLWHYFPSDKDIIRGKINLVYLGYYFEDFNNFKNMEVSVRHGLKLKPNTNPIETGSYYNNDSLDDDHVHVNQLLKYLKFGFAKVTDEMGEAIRLGLLSRENALALVEKYDGRCSIDYIIDYINYLEMTIEEFWDVARKFINTEIWKPCGKDRWVLKHPHYEREFKIPHE